MPDISAVYKYSYNDAVDFNEEKQWRDSYKLNCECAKAIEKAINENYRDNILNDCALQIIKSYGYARVNWVLANTVNLNEQDGRFSQENRELSEQYYFPREDYRRDYSVNSHPGLTNVFINQVRAEWKKLNLFDKSHCTDEDNYEGKLLVLKPSVLKDEFKHPDYQLFYATSGFGCYPESLGTQVNGKFFDDDERTNFRRCQFYGVIDEKYLPEWALEKLKTEQSEDEELTSIIMGGIK